MQNEAAILKQAQLGNKQAIASLYQTHKGSIYTYVFYRVEGNFAVADDLTAEVFGRMVAKIHTFQPNGKSIQAWLYTIARNLITDHYRDEQKINDIVEHYSSISTNPNPEHFVDISFDHLHLVQAIKQLTAEQQEVIILRFIEGRSVAETAEILDKRVGAIKTMSRRALASMLRLMEKEGYQHV